MLPQLQLEHPLPENEEKVTRREDVEMKREEKRKGGEGRPNTERERGFIYFIALMYVCIQL